VLAADETDLLLFPPLRAGWAPRGEPKRVRLTGFNARRVIFGALNLRTGRRHLTARQRQRSVDFCAFLRLLRRAYPGRPILLLLDEDSSHTAKASRAAAERAGIELLWLPKRCPHLNPMDHLWRAGKQAVCANRQYATIDVQATRFRMVVEGWSDQDALRKAGVRSKRFWLRRALGHLFCGPT
jgi:transposase